LDSGIILLDVPVIPPKKESEGICKLLFASTVVRLFLMLQQFQQVELK